MNTTLLIITMLYLSFKAFDLVSVMFCEVHGLRPQTTIQGVMSVVECMNIVFSCFDSLTDRFNVYKVNNIKYLIIIFKIFR